MAHQKQYMVFWTLLLRSPSNRLPHVVDRDTLANSLMLSPKQIKALEQGDRCSFHAYGIYLRAMRQALD